MKRLRRTMLYVPGNNPGMMRDVHIYGSDSIMFDLEDSVPLPEKDSARFLVYNALTTIDYGSVEKVVRINPLNSSFGHDDLEAIVRVKPDVIRLPKTENPEDVTEAERIIEKIEGEAGIERGSIKLMAAIESAIGVINAFGIASSSKRLVGIALGAEDFVTDLKTKRYDDGQELFYARSQILISARAAGISALDTVYSDVNNEEGFRKEVELIKKLGYDGKSIINPRQIGPVHEIFTPSKAEIEYSLKIVRAMEDAYEKKSGVISLDGKMIDRPILDRAYRILDLAEASGVYTSQGGLIRCEIL